MEDADHCVELMGEWRQLLADPTTPAHWSTVTSPMDQMDVYDRLVWEAWMPPVRRAALQWQPKIECGEGMLRLVETWAPHIPKCVLEKLLGLVVLRRLHTAVEK